MQFYLVTGPGLDEMVYVEAWREHARTTKALVQEKQVVEIENLTTRALGKKSPMASYRIGRLWSSIGANPNHGSC